MKPVKSGDLACRGRQNSMQKRGPAIQQEWESSKRHSLWTLHAITPVLVPRYGFANVQCYDDAQNRGDSCDPS